MASENDQRPQGPGTVILVNYTFTYSPHTPQASTENGNDANIRNDESGSNIPRWTASRNSGGSDAQGHESPFGVVFYGLPPIFTGQNFAAGSPPQHKHASKAAIEALKDVDVNTLPASDRVCSICFEPYYVPPVSASTDPKDLIVSHNKEVDSAHHSPELVNKADEVSVTTDSNGDSNGENRSASNDTNDEETDSRPDEKSLDDVTQHVPLQMPCGHIFGKNCLKEWLLNSTTCPLCRTAVEAERDSEPTRVELPYIFAPIFTFFRPQQQQQLQSQESEQPGESEVSNEPVATNTTELRAPEPTRAVDANFVLHPQITSSMSSTPPRTQSISAGSNVSGTGSSYAVRHHPYSRPFSNNNSVNDADSTSVPSDMAEVLARPDLECASVSLGLCEDSGSLITLECGHGYHEDCLRTSMRAHGDVDIPNLRDEPSSQGSRSGPVSRRTVWCMRCRRYRDVEI
ncbi:hypothetical protein V1511DRAFT_456461 [Dipodascopsis uninucleata]